MVEGIAASVMLGFTQEYFAPFLLLLGGSARHIGFLSAFPNMLAALLQFRSPEITERIHSRKQTILIFVFLQALTLLPVAFMAFANMHMRWLFIAFVMLFSSFGAIATPAWASMMSDIVPSRKRGVYFGRRNLIIGLNGLAFAFFAGVIIHFSQKSSAFFGFGLLFAAAALFRLISWSFMKKMHEPEIEQKSTDYFSLYQFISKIKTSNFAKFVFFSALFNFTVYFSAPFFAVFMLRDLHFDYITYSVVTLSLTFAVQITLPRWGRLADRFGNLTVLRTAAPLIGLVPLLWAVNHHPVFLVCAQIFAGMLWSGFNLCALNFLYDAVTPAKRTRCIAYFNAFNGIAMGLGGLSGGLILKWLPAVLGYKIITLMILSAILRIAVSLFFSKLIKEVRPVKKIRGYQLVLRVVGVIPLLDIIESRSSRRQSAAAG
jgi:MFS family permease